MIGLKKYKTDLDERVNSNDLMYWYKGKTAYAKFDEFDNALDIVNNGKTDLADVKNNHQKFKSCLGKIKKETNQKNKKILCTILKCSIKQETKLLNFTNFTRQIVYSLYQSKGITKKVYNNIIESTQ